ncbi:MAG: hypothetical protein H5T85_00630 [Actinobacteria bacterium]|nr:hypothetical protein [Actinomycetota bacterium]
MNSQDDVQGEVYKALVEIIEDYVKGNFTEIKAREKIKNLLKEKVKEGT